jgi:hypothetical protein
MSVIRLQTGGTLRGAKPGASHAGSQAIEIMDGEIGRFRRIVCLQQLGRAFGSQFSHAAAITRDGKAAEGSRRVERVLWHEFWKS